MLERSMHVGAHRRGRVITIDWRRDGGDSDHGGPAGATVMPGVAEWAVRVERRLVDVLGVADERDRQVTGPWAADDLREEALRLRGDARINAYVVRPDYADPFVIVAAFAGRHPRKTFCRLAMRLAIGPASGVVDAFVGAAALTLLHPPAEVRRAPFYIVAPAVPRHGTVGGYAGHPGSGYVGSQRSRS